MQLKIVLISLTTTQQEKQIAFSRALMSERHIRFPINFETIVICKSQSTKDEKNPVQNSTHIQKERPAEKKIQKIIDKEPIARQSFTPYCFGFSCN